MRHECPSKPGKLKLENVFQVFVELVTKENNYLSCSSEILGYIKIFDLFQYASRVYVSLGYKELSSTSTPNYGIHQKKSAKKILFLVPVHEMYVWQF